MTRFARASALASLLLASGVASAQRHAVSPPWQGPSIIGSPPAAPSSSSSSLLERAGSAAAARLMHSTDPDERLRGIERAAGMRTTEALTLLERAARSNGPGGLDPRLPDEGIARKDPRALLAVVRALADRLDNDGARVALGEVLRAPGEVLASRPALPVRDAAAEEAEGAARVTLARQEAAIALAESGVSSALELLVATARSGGASQEAALVGLSVHPPSDPLILGGVALTTPSTIALAVRIGDLRTLDAILGAVRASDPALRASAMAALGAAGDTRGIDVANASLSDADPRVRVAAAGALADLAAPGAPAAVEALVGDDATVLEGLQIATRLQGEGLTKAAAARAAASADPVTRSAALAVLGRQTDAEAVQALGVFLLSPTLQGDAAGALARSPSPFALGAIEALAGASGRPDASLPRLAARAYLVRALTRGERSRSLDALLDVLAESRDARDRAVGLQALIALGRRPLEAALSDADPRVRRAGAMGVLADRSPRTARAFVAHASTETDEPTRRVLALGWLDREASERVATSVLSERATSGGPDAPLAALALARRLDDALAPSVDALLAAHDPLLRAHTARGLGLNRTAAATGRLARAYAREGDASVRRAIVEALAGVPPGEAKGTRDETLALAARLDPDPVARWTASSALAGPGAHRDAAGLEEIAWLRLLPAEGAAAMRDPSGLVAPSNGIAVPIAFDDEGYALVPGISPGEARLRLAPGLPAVTPPGP